MGRSDIVTGPGRIGSKAIDALSSDLARLITLSATGSTQQSVNQLNCIAVPFKVEKGIARSDAILVDTGRVTVRGTGSIDLRAERIDLLLTPNPKDASLANYLAVPVHVGGTLANPSFTPDKTAVAQGGRGRSSRNRDQPVELARSARHRARAKRTPAPPAPRQRTRRPRRSRSPSRNRRRTRCAAKSKRSDGASGACSGGEALLPGGRDRARGHYVPHRSGRAAGAHSRQARPGVAMPCRRRGGRGGMAIPGRRVRAGGVAPHAPRQHRNRPGRRRPPWGGGGGDALRGNRSRVLSRRRSRRNWCDARRRRGSR